MPYAGSPVVHALIAPSTEYLAEPGGIGVLGSSGAW